LGAVTDVQHVDGAALDDEQDPVSHAQICSVLPTPFGQAYALAALL